MLSFSEIYADRVTSSHEQDAQPTKREQRVQRWRRRIMKGTEQTPDEELKQAQEVLSWARRKHSPDSPFSIKAMIDVANQLARQDRVSEEAELREQIVASLRHHGPDNLNTVSAEMQLASCLVALERYEDADQLLHHVIVVRTRELGEDDPETLRAMSVRSHVANKLG